MSLLDSPTALLAGIFALALAAPVLAVAAVEPAPPQRWPRGVVVVAAAWSLVFVAGAGLALRSAEPAGAGLLAAAGELAAALAIWCLRSGRRDRGDDDDGGNDDDPPPPRPGPADQVDWDFWERELVDEPMRTADSPA